MMGNAKVQAELLLPDDLCSFETVSELEDPLDRQLIEAGVGEVLGGGIGSGWYRFDLELTDYDAAIALLSEWAEKLGLPEGSCLRRKGQKAIAPVVAKREA